MFVCNLCGHYNKMEPKHLENPELPSCTECASNVRFRWLVHRLSLEVFGTSKLLPQFPYLRGVRGIGLTDPAMIAQRLAQVFTYVNTFYDCEPRFDIRRDPSPFGDLDFIIASEVFEHIEPPVELAFRNAAELLRPGGVLLLTVPWVWEGTGEHPLPQLYDWKLASEDGRWVLVNRLPTGEIQKFYDPSFDGRPGPAMAHTREHFPDLFDWTLAERDGEWLLTNRTREGSIEHFHNLTFHGGHGLALEMRLFVRADIERYLLAAGFRSVEFESAEAPQNDILFPYAWSRPIVAHR